MLSFDVSLVKKLYAIPVTLAEAKIFYEMVSVQYGVSIPSLKFTGTFYPKRRGTYYHYPPRILIHQKGEQVATVIHEMAHHINLELNHIRGHGRTFASIHSDLLKFAENLLYRQSDLPGNS